MLTQLIQTFFIKNVYRPRLQVQPAIDVKVDVY